MLLAVNNKHRLLLITNTVNKRSVLDSLSQSLISCDKSTSSTVQKLATANL